MTLSIRQRLTLWYVTAAAVMLAVVALSLVVVHERISLARLDTELARLNHAVATVLANELRERKDPHVAAEEALVEVVVPRRHLAIFSTDGAVVATRWTLSTPPRLDLLNGPEVTLTLGGRDAARVLARTVSPVPPGFVVLTAADWDELAADRTDLVRALLMVLPLALLVTTAMAWWMAGRALQPAARMADEARLLSHESTGGRLTVSRQDELGRLAVAFNGLVDRLESALAVRRQFLAEASHELRTPVSIAQTAADVALGRHDRSDTEYRDALELVARQMKHLGRIVSDMLILARSDASDWPITALEFYFDELVADATASMSLVAIDCGVTIEVTTPDELQVRGDEGLLRQMLVNLLDNAIRHTPPGGAVHASVTTVSGDVVLSVRDTGHGIAEMDRERIFERFVHVAVPGRGPDRNGAGTGLGLAIAQRIARAHQGDLMLVETGPTGTHFSATLPILCGPRVAGSGDRNRRWSLPKPEGTSEKSPTAR
jgi:signal transduction histidine kinase